MPTYCTNGTRRSSGLIAQLRSAIKGSNLRQTRSKVTLRPYKVQVSTYQTSGHLRSGEIVLMRGEVPRQQLLDAVDRLIGDLFEHAAKRIDSSNLRQSARSRFSGTFDVAITIPGVSRNSSSCMSAMTIRSSSPTSSRLPRCFPKASISSNSSRVPHPRRVFVFAPRVGLEPQEAGSPPEA